MSVFTLFYVSGFIASMIIILIKNKYKFLHEDDSKVGLGLALFLSLFSWVAVFVHITELIICRISFGPLIKVWGFLSKQWDKMSEVRR